ncbi:signal peptidase I [Staphylococcus massiliensis]|uniref:Signal peptidase I n=1 Tax=Staphylococcus massiliensis S46 TaxID=1229783 RepID=K9AJF7_9STAP|nr:signal peptidase I [Staphylococcus massiliensis]EKU47448.1 type-1 signal peptidase 1B [Staphylococcus massiliensis S46]MCG3400364.1 signal peptidase I [Staphylococcus massiliensis]
MSKTVKDWLIAIVIGVIIAFLLNYFVMKKYTVQGDSMDPTFKNGEQLIINKLSVTFNRVDRGDVIVFHADRDHDYIKRLIGKPGDTVSYKNDQLYINGKKIQEPYLEENKKHKYTDTLTEDFTVEVIKGAKQGQKEIPKGKYLVLGDNRAISKDSRGQHGIGFVSKDQVVGTALIRFYPLDRFDIGFGSKDFEKVN